MMDIMSALDASIELEELMSQLSVWLNDVRVGDYFSSHRQSTDSTERMKKVWELEAKGNQHPIVKELFNWLSYPQRNADDFISVASVLWKNFGEDFGCRRCLPYLGKVMIEALAIQQPILKNSWEHAALFVLNFYDQYTQDDNNISLDHLSAWIIHVIGDPTICLKLRIKFISMSKKLAFVNDDNVEIAFKSVMFACSSLNIKDELDCFLLMNPSAITKMFDIFYKDLLMTYFDNSMCEKLRDMRTSELSAILHDVSYVMRINSTRYIEPMEVQGLIALLNTISRYAQLEYKLLQEGQGLLLKAEHIANLEDISGAAQTLIFCFCMSCRMPQIIGVTATCFMDTVELVLQAYASNPPGRDNMYFKSLYICEQLLSKLYLYERHSIFFSWNAQEKSTSRTHEIVTSPIVREISSKFSGRLRGLRSKLGPVEPVNKYFPYIHILVWFDELKC